ncbi:MAG: CBS domain-containing protein [Candidatus Bathyarchaeia archaeon]
MNGFSLLYDLPWHTVPQQKYSWNINSRHENILVRIRLRKMLPPIEEIGRRRRLLALSQKELAKLSGVSQSMIAKIESGRISPSYLKTKAIFDMLEGLERKNEVKAKEICHGKVVGVQAHDTISRAVRVMRETGYSQLPVFDSGQAVGSLTEKVILQTLVGSTRPEEVSKQSVDKIMDEALPTVNDETPISMVSALLSYESAVIVTKRGKVLGIITKADLLKVLGT